MKSFLSVFIALFSFVFYAQGQDGTTVSTNPTIVIQGSSVTITFDVSSSTTLAGNTGPLYVHTGVITTASTSNSDWKNVVPAAGWPTSSATVDDGVYNIPGTNKLTNSGTNKWTLTISNINTYYGLSAGTIVTQLAFVVRNATGTVQSTNLYVPVYQSGLNVLVTAPANNNSLIATGTTSTLSAVASNGSTACVLNLYVGATSLSSLSSYTSVASGTTSASGSYTFSTAGNYYVVAKVVSGGVTKYDSSYVCVAPTTPPIATYHPTKEGVTLSADSVTFCFSLAYGGPVTGSTAVFLVGDCNNFLLDNHYLMKRHAESITYGKPTYFYWITVSKTKFAFRSDGEYAYQYYVTGLTNSTNNNSDIRVGDPYCQKILDPNNDQYINQTYTIYPNLRPYPSSQASGILSCFQINPTTYNWQYSSGFTPPAQNKLMIYEMLFRDFTAQGSVQAAIQQLDYIKALGVNAVEVMPIMEFDGNNSWGYNPNFYFAPDKAYGTKSDYQQFIDECHKRGLAVILDVVFNHTWGLSPYCMIYWDATNSRPLSTSPYYNALAPHPYSVGNDLNHTDPRVKRWLKRALAFWLTEYKVDGFRFDLSKGFTQTQSYGGAANPTATTLCETYDASRISNIETYVDTIKTVNSNAYAILEHFCNDDEENALAAHQNTMLWRNMANAFQQAAMGYSSESDFSSLMQTGGSFSSPYSQTNRVAYAESHDEYRMGYKAITWGLTAVTDTTNVMQQLAVCGAFMALNPGPRMMWEFGELGADYASKDASGNNITSPFPAEWNYLNISARKTLHDTYAKILNFRQTYSSLFANPTSFNWQVTTSDWSNGRRIYLTDGTNYAIILGNFTATGAVTVTPSFPFTGTWYELISGQSLNVTNTAMSLPLPIFGLQIYTNQQINTGIKTVYNNEAKVFPNPVTDYLYIAGGQATQIEIDGIGGDVLLNQPVQSNAVSLQSLPVGIYIGRVTFDDGSVKIIKLCKK